MEYETVGAAVDGSAVGQPKYKVKSKRKPLEVVMNTIFFLCGMVAVAFVLIISVYLVISGMPAILEIGPINFLFGTRWYASTNDFGILAIILTSFAGTAGAIIIGVPIGLMTAIFLAKVANLSWLRWPIPNWPRWSTPPWNCWPASPLWCTAWWV